MKQESGPHHVHAYSLTHSAFSDRRCTYIFAIRIAVVLIFSPFGSPITYEIAVVLIFSPFGSPLYLSFRHSDRRSRMRSPLYLYFRHSDRRCTYLFAIRIADHVWVATRNANKIATKWQDERARQEPPQVEAREEHLCRRAHPRWRGLCQGAVQGRSP